jgi:cytosine/adenosine deaminase-related metal-dependent hydrolase
MRSTVGLVDAHSHLRSTTVVAQGVPGSCLEEAILRMNAMTGVDPIDDAFVATSDLLSNGVTGVQAIFHTFGTPEQYLNLLRQTLAGIRKSRIRARVILAITDQFEFLPERLLSFTLPDFVTAGPRMSPRQFIETFEAAVAEHPDIQFGIGPVAPQWCSDAMMEAIGAKAREGIRVHTHCLESQSQRSWIKDSPIPRLDRYGLLGGQTSLAHAIWLSEDELDLVSDRGAQLVTCPRSNQVLRSGRAEIDAWIARGIDFAIGLDSIAGSESPLAAALLTIDDEQATRALTIGGASAAGLATMLDEVRWKDWRSGKVEALFLGGQQLIFDGELDSRDEVEAARNRITDLMERDQKARDDRQRRLSAIMSDYLAAIT